MLKSVSYCLAFCFSAFALFSDTNQKQRQQASLSLIGGAPLPICFVNGSQNCPVVDPARVGCSGRICKQHPTNVNLSLCVRKDDGSQYDEHIQDNTKYDSVQVATVTKSGKKSWAEGAAVVCISSKGCNTCKFVGGENPWLCQADGNNNGAIESRLPTSPTGDDCSLPPP